MPSILLPHIIKQQEKMERERERANAPTRHDEIVEFVRKDQTEAGNYDQMDVDDFRCSSYKDYKDYVMDDLLCEMPVWAKQFFNLDGMIEAENQDDGFWIVYDDNDHGMKYLHEIGDLFPIWKNREMEFFKNHPCKDTMFYMVEYRP
jgi:hypothetical protein